MIKFQQLEKILYRNKMLIYFEKRRQREQLYDDFAEKMEKYDNKVIKAEKNNQKGLTEAPILQPNYLFKLNLIIIFYRKINDFMQFCTNCQKSLPEDRFDLHLGYCRRNIKRCAQCNKPYDINNLQEHNQQFHNFQNCQYCSTKIISREIAQHKKNCLAKPIQCTYCQMSIPTDRYQDHKQQCEARTQTCQKCQKPVVNREYFDHLGKCQGKVANSTPSNSSSNSNTYYANSSYSQPVTYISSQSGPNSSATTYYQQGTSSNTVYSPNVIRTYTRTYVPGENQSGSTSVSYSGPSTSVPTTTTTYTTNSTNSNSGTTSYSTSNPVRRVISTRVITHPYNSSEGTGIKQINSNSSQQISNTNITSPNPVTYTTTYYRSPSTNPIVAGQTGITYGYPTYSATSDLSQGSSYDEDPQLQAALLASLGYQDENSPALYSQIQKQHELYKQFNKK